MTKTKQTTRKTKSTAPAPDPEVPHDLADAIAHGDDEALAAGLEHVAKMDTLYQNPLSGYIAVVK